MLLPDVTEFSIPAAVSRYADCARAMKIALATDSDETANNKLMEELKAINDELDVPTPAAFGISKDDFFEVRHTMAEQALASGSPGNNPRVPSAEEIVGLYEKLWV
jgi:alcohol dehydrogenase class IV